MYIHSALLVLEMEFARDFSGENFVDRVQGEVDDALR